MTRMEGMVMNYRIRNECGQWYKGNGEWGPIPEVAEVFDSIENLPDTITGDDGKTYLLHLGWVPHVEQSIPRDDYDPSVGYYPDELDNDWCYARIEWC